MAFSHERIRSLMHQVLTSEFLGWGLYILDRYDLASSLEIGSNTRIET